ncbi:MAG: phosphatase PAP2 family protein [Bacteroidota bacterium]
MMSRSVQIVAAVYLCFFTFFLGLYMMGEHGDAVLAVNARRHLGLDLVMPVLTHLGDGWFFSIAVLGLLLVRWRSGLVLLALGLLQLFMSWLLKRVIFKGTPRPKTFFSDQGISLDFISGVDVHSYNAFPSGHTMTAFAIATFFFLYSRKLWVGMVALLLAMVTGFSRIYLLQHFLIDVVIGSLVGVLLAATVYLLFRSSLTRENPSAALRSEHT